MWSCDTFSLTWKVQTLSLVPSIEDIRDINKGLEYPRISPFTISPDSEVLAYYGSSSSVFVWDLREKRLIHEIVIPSLKEQLFIHGKFISKQEVS
jgi:WD40 repeat protein